MIERWNNDDDDADDDQNNSNNNNNNNNHHHHVYSSIGLLFYSAVITGFAFKAKISRDLLTN
jgi:hypothetical protein